MNSTADEVAACRLVCAMQILCEARSAICAKLEVLRMHGRVAEE